MDNNTTNDKRIDSMEIDLRDIREKQTEMQCDITQIREKIFNGFSHAISESHVNTKEIKQTLRGLEDTVKEMSSIVYQTPEQRLANCPLKKELIDSYEKRMNKLLVIGGGMIALLSGIPAWIMLVKG